MVIETIAEILSILGAAAAISLYLKKEICKTIEKLADKIDKLVDNQNKLNDLFAEHNTSMIQKHELLGDRVAWIEAYFRKESRRPEGG